MDCCIDIIQPWRVGLLCIQASASGAEIIFVYWWKQQCISGLYSEVWFLVIGICGLLPQQLGLKCINEVHLWIFSEVKGQYSVSLREHYRWFCTKGIERNIGTCAEYSILFVLFSLEYRPRVAAEDADSFKFIEWLNKLEQWKKFIACLTKFSTPRGIFFFF